MENCIFCKIIKGSEESYVVDETDEVISFLALENHPMVVSKEHIANIYNLDQENGTLLMSELIKVANATKKGLDCDGIYITQTNESAAGQSVFHIHFHVYPKWKDNAKDVKLMEKQEVLEKIKNAINSEG